MGNTFQQQITIVNRSDIRPGTSSIEAAFFDVEGNPLSLDISTAAHVAAITTVDGSDATTTQALANATKTTVNSILTALEGAGLMAST